MEYSDLEQLITHSIRMKEAHKSEMNYVLDRMSLTTFMMEYGMLNINMGRQVGHTQYIKDHMCQYSDMVIAINSGMVRNIAKSVPPCRVHLARSNASPAPCQTLWVDCASFIKRDDIKRWVDVLRPRLIVCLG